MARPRKELHQILVDSLGSKYVYFQPPESIKLTYPCIVYRRTGSYNKHADDDIYRHSKVYEGILITKDPDSDVPDKLEKLRYCSLERVYTADNLNHYAFKIYF